MVLNVAQRAADCDVCRMGIHRNIVPSYPRRRCALASHGAQLFPLNPHWRSAGQEYFLGGDHYDPPARCASGEPGESITGCVGMKSVTETLRFALEFYQTLLTSKWPNEHVSAGLFVGSRFVLLLRHAFE